MKKLFTSLAACALLSGISFSQPVADFSGGPTTLCAGGNVTWANLTTGTAGTTTWAWQFPGGVNPTSTIQNPGPRNYSVPGVYGVTLIVTSTNGIDTMYKPNYITVLQTPTTTVTPSPGYVCSLGSVTLTANGAATYSWSPATGLNTTTGSVVISTPTANITYAVVGTNSSGCTNTANVNVVINTVPPPTPSTITGPASVCSGQTAIYTVSTTGVPAGTIRTWTVPSGASIIAGQGTRSVTITFGGTSGSVCCTASNPCGSSAASCLTVTVNPTPQVGTVGTITGASSVCANQTGVTYYIAPVANAASYTWTATGSGTVTAGQGTNTITVDFGGTNSNICVSAGNACNFSTPVCKTVTVSPSIPNVPGTITGPTTVCSGQTNVGYSVATVATTTYYSWTVPSGATINAGQGTRSVSITFGASSGTVCVSDSNACGMSAANCKAVTVDPSAVVGTIGTITGPTAICANATGVTYSIASVTGATTYVWTVPGGATIATGQGTETVTVDFGTNGGNVCVTAANSCSTSPQKCITVTATPGIPNVPGTITGPTTVCAGQSGIAYSVSTVPTTTYYSWTIPSGAAITAGQGTRSITVTFGASSGTVCVSDSNACGMSAANCKGVTVDPSVVVGAIGTITGPTAICANSTGMTYSIPAVTGATIYTWTVPGTATITAGQGTETVTVDFAANGGNVCVTAANNCSTSPQKCIAVTATAGIPNVAGTITGPTTVCSGQSGVAYSVATVPATTYYSWTVPSGASVTAGQGTRSVTVTFGASSGTVCVSDSNVCGISAPNCKAITVDPNSAVGTIGTITGPTTICANDAGVTYSIPSVSVATTYTWTVPGTATITAGQGTETVTVDFGTGNGNICVTGGNSCSTSPQKCITIGVSTIPATPGTITGPTTVCSGQTAIYTVPNGGAPAGTIRTWTVPPGATVIAGQGTRSVTITFGTTTGTVCCTASNTCGSSAPNCITVTVDPNPTVGTVSAISGPAAVCANSTGVTYSIPAVTGATTYTWTVPGTATITAGQGTETVTVDFAGTSGNICVTAANNCSTSPQKCMTVTVSPNIPNVPGTITGPTTVCNAQASVGFSVASDPATIYYSWTVPSGATLNAGQGTNSVSITFGASSGTVCVSDSNACGMSAPSCQTITVDPNPALGAVGTITGIAAACAGQTGVTYSIANVTNATSYNWTIPTLATIASGQGTNTITVDFGNVSGNICVDASNSCSTTSANCTAVTISPAAPAMPGGITGATTVCNSQSGVSYSISAVANATSYTWSVPSGGSITSGQGTTNITVSFGSTSGTVCVTADNVCGASASSCQAITVNASILSVPTPTTSAASCSSCCDGTATAAPTGGTAPYTYAWNTTPVQTSATANNLCASTDYTVCVTDAMGCVTCSSVNIPFATGISTLTDNGTIKVFPNPANNEIFIEGIMSAAANLQVNIWNMFGQKMQDKTFFTNGSFTERMSIESLPSGVYFIEIKSGDMKRETKIVKIP